jgi:acyl-coenzyme A synthetase/AMP-(fatty) acid ligase
MNDVPAKKNRPAGVVEKEKITIWHSIPSAVEFMIINEKSKIYDFSSLRLMSFCGEPLRKHQVEFLLGKQNSLTIFNTYGPTEGTLFCTWQELNLKNYLSFCEFTMSIGKALPGWTLKLADIPNHDEKEIIIHGDYIAKGYLGELANTKFHQIDINGEIERAFETGDLVNEKNGSLYFIGRKDRQVQIKGSRVELDEIDFRINEFLNKTSVTLVRKDSLCSFIESEEPVDEVALRDFLKKKLEAYKIPNAFYIIREIPRNQNQKVDNTSLLKLLP